MNQKVLILSIGLALCSTSLNTLATEEVKQLASESQVQEAAEDNWVSLAEAIAVHLENASALYANNQDKEAKREIIKAYFGVFEDKKMEAAMRMELGAKYTYKVERRFGDLRKVIKNNLPIDKFNQQMQDLIVIMREDAVKLDEAGIPMEVFKVD
jgi:fumarate hydratase class II/high-affinity iron transporter